MLSNLTVRQAKVTGKPYTLADTDGLSLFVPATGAKAWHFRFSWGGKRDRMSFGTYPAHGYGDRPATLIHVFGAGAGACPPRGHGYALVWRKGMACPRGEGRRTG